MNAREDELKHAGCDKIPAFCERTQLLIGESGLKALSSVKVAVVGCGGVGAYVAHFLVRAGVTNLTIIDFDIVSQSNINRQIIANTNTVGMAKTEVLKSQLLSINQEAIIRAYLQRASKDTFDKLLCDCEYIADCIDNVTNKIDLILYAHEKGKKIITACGAGNRIDIPCFEVKDLFKTSGDGLAKVLRKKLRMKIKHLPVVIAKSLPIKHGQKVTGSISYYPPACACVMAGYLVNEILKESKNESD